MHIPKPIDYSKYKGLILDLQDGIMTVTLSNPGRRNAITHEMSDDLTLIWEDLWLDPEVRVIILTGDGADFCSGADVKVLSEQNREKTATRFARPGPVNWATRQIRKHVLGILDCEKPVLAKVRGVAYGAGVNMAMACDMVFASPTARFCDSHVRVGMAAGDGGVLLWPLLCGMHRAKEYLMTGDPVEADVAERIGLVNRVLPEDQLDAHVQKMAEKLRDLPPHAVNYTKVALNTALKQMTGAAFETSIAYEIYTQRMDDFNEATDAFVEKRKPVYRGT